MDLFQYTELPNSQSIRILTLHPGSYHDEITCSLSVSQLDNLEKYEAISYTWGDAKIAEEISVGDSRLAITTNLIGALRRFRLEDRDRKLWADAICINQHNLSERSQQVGIMRDIFQKASRTFVWLG
ncbi:hypothetical protein M501DRAFT_924367, partial [Patellaria atrata CBS 101060]